jgi:hypothetical protein
MTETYIYGLKDPMDNQIHYVGKSDSPKARYSSHLRDDCSNHHKTAWIAALRDAGLRPELVILQEVQADQWDKAERKWIADGLSMGWPLTNIASGGGMKGCGIREKWAILMARFLHPTEREQFAALSDAAQLEVCAQTALTLIDTKRFQPAAETARLTLRGAF